MRRTPFVGLALASAVLAGIASLPAFSSPVRSAAVAPFTFDVESVGDNSAGYGEPSIAISPDGKHTVVSAPGGGGVRYWYSADFGKTWGTTDTVSENGGGDSELLYLEDGSLLSADLEIVDSNIKISTDNGATWDAGRPAGVEQDRQWLAVSNDGETQYLVYHDFVVEAEVYAKSSDGGKTWDPFPYVIQSPDQIAAPGQATTPASGDPASLLDQGVNTFSGPMLVDPQTDDLYVLYSISDFGSNLLGGTPPFGPTRGIVVAHSPDAGGTWTNTYAVTSFPDPTDPTGAGAPVNGAIFPWGAVDPDGTVYVFFNSTKVDGHFHMYYVYSTDHAATWSEPVLVDGNPAGTGAAIYATGAAGAPGVLDLAWYSTPNGTSPDDTNADWYVEFAQVRNAASATPSITRSRVSDRSIHHGDICLNGLLCLLGGDRSLLDFFELAIGKDGMAQIAFAENADANQITWAGQTSGPSAYAAAVTPPVVTPPRVTPPRTTPPKGKPPAPPLAATGASDTLPMLALSLLSLAGLGLAVRRRSAHVS